MLNDFIVVTGQVAILFLLMGVGFLLAKLDKLSESTTSQLSFLLLYVISPCLVVESMQVDLTQSLLINLGKATLAFIASYVIFILIARPLFPSRDKDTRPVLQFGVIFANTGFMGFPLIAAVVGQEALIYAVASVAVFTIIQWSYGQALLGGKVSVRSILINPGTLSILLGLVLLFSGLRLPGPVNSVVSYLADMNTPLAMVVIGAQMARANIKETFRRYRLFQASLVRLVILPAIVALVLLPFHLEPMLYCSAVLLSAAPTAGATSIFANQLGRNTAAAAQLVTLSTLLSMVTLPVFAILSRVLTGM
jgi:hypothetical protein